MNKSKPLLFELWKRCSLETTPENATHWSTRSMAEASGMSQTAVSRIWRAFGLQPHRFPTFKLSDVQAFRRSSFPTFKLSKGPQFVEKVRDVVGLYRNPPENAVVLSVDEKSQCQALDRSQPALSMTPGRPESQTHDPRYLTVKVGTGRRACFRP